VILSVMRHGKSVPQDDTQDDAQRELAPKGAKGVKAVAKTYAKAGELEPDVIFTGPETRNMQTAMLTADKLGVDPSNVVQSTNLGPAGDAQKAFQEIKDWVKTNGDPDDSEVLAIGSDPVISNLVQLVHGLGTKPNQSGQIKMKKGSLAKMKVYGIDGPKPTSELRSYLPPGLAGA
jgi:phosphohistidine phosphatase SixA